MTKYFWQTTCIQVLSYIACLVVSKYLAGISAMTLSGYIFRLMGFGSRAEADALAFYVGHWLVFNTICGILIGFFIYLPWTSTATLFVWLPFGVILAIKILNHPQSVLIPNHGAGLQYFFSLGCRDISLSTMYIGKRCLDQFQYSLPFYAAAGLSVGVLLRRTVRHVFASWPRLSIR